MKFWITIGTAWVAVGALGFGPLLRAALADRRDRRDSRNLEQHPTLFKLDAYRASRKGQGAA